MTVIQEKMSRVELISLLRTRDGDKCRYPGCDTPMDFTNITDESPLKVTIDHWIPQWIIRDVAPGDPDPWESGRIPEWIGKREDWDYDRIWAPENLRLMHKKCNAKKGDLIPHEDGTLPEKNVRKFRYRRDKRATRVGACPVCDNGNWLLVGEVCASCGGDARAFPRSHFIRTQDCDHAIYWCQWCSIGDIPRENPIAVAMRQADSTELGEMFSNAE